MADEIRVDGHKIFVSANGDTVFVEAVNDERPLVRMVFELSDEDAWEIGHNLIAAAKSVRRP